MAGVLGFTPDEVLQIGQSNINSQEFNSTSIADLIHELTGMEVDDSPNMLVLSSPDRIQGARALLSEKALNEVHNKLGDFTVLPSSIHEIICVPAGSDPDALKSMVREINATQVRPEEKLSDEIFAYDGRSLTLVNNSIEITQSHSYKMSM